MNKFHIFTQHPVAADSKDHLFPGGTMHDNSRNRRFNTKLYAWLDARPLRVMDLGCAGGGFVKDCLDDGHVAVGVDGSDYSTLWDGPGGTDAEKASRKPGRRAEWATIPDNLFTADITKPFAIEFGRWDYDDRNEAYFKGTWAMFDVVTAWEVMEHLPVDGLPRLCQNVKSHLTQEGVWIMSVSTQAGFHHVTLKDRPWWLNFFTEQGFENLPGRVAYFGDDWVRGPQQNAPESFHLILRVKR